MQKLSLDFYRRENVLEVAKDLLGKIIVTKWEGETTTARIVEVEAYNGIVDKASHAWNGRRTARTEIMYANGGVAYVYLCYGIHHLFNVVTNVAGIPHAVLIRAGEPLKGVDVMLKRVGKARADFSLTRGPGNLAKALGIQTYHTGFSLSSRHLYLTDDGVTYAKKEIGISPRIGVDYAGADALLPYRFFIKGSLYVSGKI
jgi:DNA-3-methyladenine glycosylase